MPDGAERPAGIPGSVLHGPFPVGSYSAALRSKLREMARVQVFGEVVGFKVGRSKVFWELRDGSGALPCSMWRRDWEAHRVGVLEEGVQVVCAGGPDFYPGSRTSSPSFSFAVDDVHVAGEGDLLAQLAALRRRLQAEGMFEPQKLLPRPGIPRCIGVVTGESGKARDDVVAGLRRRGWGGRLVWAFAPVQDRHAAGAVTRALQDLAAVAEVDVVIVARGGGSLMDLFAFCDETLCRTVSLLRVPVIASVGHHTDTTLIDDVAAVACSTPTHAAEAAVPVHVGEARARAADVAQRLAAQRARVVADTASALDRAERIHAQGRRTVRDRARTLAALSRAPAAHLDRHRTRLHQQLREVRAAAARGLDARSRALAATGSGLARGAVAGGVGDRRRAELERFAQLLAVHDPQRTLERGYALVEGPDGEPVGSADAARRLPRMTVRLHDGTVGAVPDDGERRP